MVSGLGIFVRKLEKQPPMAQRTFGPIAMGEPMTHRTSGPPVMVHGTEAYWPPPWIRFNTKPAASVKWGDREEEEEEEDEAEDAAADEEERPTRVAEGLLRALAEEVAKTEAELCYARIP